MGFQDLRWKISIRSLVILWLQRFLRYRAEKNRQTDTQTDKRRWNLLLLRDCYTVGLGGAVRATSALRFSDVIRWRPTKSVATCGWRQCRVTCRVVRNWLPAELEFFRLEQLQAAPSVASLDATLLPDHVMGFAGGNPDIVRPSVFPVIFSDKYTHPCQWMKLLLFDNCKDWWI